jgi:hypothetical protein
MEMLKRSGSSRSRSRKKVAAVSNRHAKYI